MFAFLPPIHLRSSSSRASSHHLIRTGFIPKMNGPALREDYVIAGARRVSRPLINMSTDLAPTPERVSSSGRAALWTVHKFGGSSLGDANRFKLVAEIVAKEASDSSHRVFVVVSAIRGATDRLLSLVDAAVARNPSSHYSQDVDGIADLHEQLAKDILPQDACNAFVATMRADCKDIKDLLRACWIARSASERIRDLVVGHGELWSAQLLWALLRSSYSMPCSWLDARDVLIARPSEASVQRRIVEFDRSLPLLDQWIRSNPTNVVIATGFICQDREGVPSTLGRNGSDYSASVFASLLTAFQLHIWTDVDGVYSADPRIVTDAVVIPNMTYKEAAELAYFGAKVLHPDTMAPIIDSAIPMRIRNTFNREFPGTLVHATPPGTEEEKKIDFGKLARDMAGVKGFTTVQNVSLINIEGTGMIGVPGIASRAFESLFKQNVSVILIAQASSEFSICIAIPSSQCTVALDAVRKSFRPELSDGLVSSISALPDCSILAMVGEHMQQRPGVSSRLFGSLTRAGVNIIAMAQGSSEHNISVVVSGESESRALRAAHSAFYLSDQTVSLGVIGPGVVGKAFLSQVQSQLSTLDEKFSVNLRVRGIATSRKMIFGEPIDLDGPWKAEFNAPGTADVDLDAFADYIQDTALPHAVICDCTASDVVSSYYQKWLERGIHIITPNKKANSGPYEFYSAMRAAQRRLNTHFFYEANVGAGLPIISSIRDLMRTGDTFLEIQGIFSGTLSFIFNEFDGSEPFSAVVNKAKENGYTEPDPRDDLSGMDVARKVVIVAREVGLNIELSDVPVKSLVPDALAGDDVSIDDFMQRLPDYDEELTSMANEAAEAGELLRYVGVIDAQTGRCAVELRKYKENHPFGRLQGTDNIVSFRTKRYDAQPLVVQGPGAGAAVTAAGVFGDLLRLTGYLGAPSGDDLS